MRILGVLFSVCVFASACFAQGDFLKRMAKNKNIEGFDMKSGNAGGARFQMKSHTRLEVDLETSVLDTSSHETFSYNAQGNELEFEERYYYENGGDYMSKISKSYDASGYLIREDRLSYDFGLGRYVTDEHGEFENNQDGLPIRENIYSEGSSEYYAYNMFEFDANGNQVKKTYYRVINGVAQQEIYRTSFYTNDGRLVEFREYSCPSGNCELSQGTDYKYLPNGLRESETNFENVDGVHEPYSTRIYGYDAGDRLVKIYDLKYDQGESVPDEEYNIIYGSTGIVDSIVINAYDADNRTWGLDLAAFDFDFDEEIDRDDLVLPSFYSEDYFLNGILFGKKLNEFRVVDYNEDGSVDYEELLKYNYSNFTSVKEQTVFDFTLSPNPASDHITIGLNDTNTQRIEVYSIDGTLMHAEDISTSELNINVQDYKRGTYLVKAIGVNGFRTKQFVKL